MRGSGGPVVVTVQVGTNDQTVELLLSAPDKAGWPLAEDVNAEDSQHIGFTPSTIKTTAELHIKSRPEVERPDI